jgi:nucleotide-binding universal stress UspA family protein
MAKTLGARLHVMTAGAQAPTAQELARRLSAPVEEFNAVAIETAPGDFVDTVLRTVKALSPALVILAVRLRDEARRGGAQARRTREQASEALGRRLLKKIAGPILVVPPDKDMSAWRLQRELLPQDGTPGCACALAQIIRQSPQKNMEHLILRVAGARIDQPTEPGSLATPRYVDHPQHEWEAWSREFLDRIVGMGANLNAAGLKLLVASGEPGAEILRVAREQAVDMIVMPWHGVLDPGRARMIKTVLHGASCPVLLLPQPDSRNHSGGA